MQTFVYKCNSAGSYKLPVKLEMECAGVCKYQNCYSCRNLIPVSSVIMCLSHAPAEDLHELTRAHTVNLASSSDLLLCSKIQLCKVNSAFLNGENYCQKGKHFATYVRY